LIEVDDTRERREQAVSAAFRTERAAWAELERASRPASGEGGFTDEIALRASRARWQAASHSLVDALEALKSVPR
jgi:hypothetical protein